MIRTGGIALAALTLTGAAPARDSVGFDIRSWGMLVGAWRIDSRGEGIVRQSGDGPRVARRMVTTRRLRVGPAGYAQLVDILKPVEAAARAHHVCAPTMTDMPYGAVRWVRRGRSVDLPYNDGCRGAPDDALRAARARAWRLVRRWAEGAPVIDAQAFGAAASRSNPVNEAP